MAVRRKVSSPAKPAGPELDAWVGVVHVYHRVLRRLEQALDAHGLSLPQLAALACLAAEPAARAAEPRRPNVVLIVTDNQGAWTLGCYGNPDVKTPVIDDLAKQGMLFSNCFASNPVCSPTRATVMTGLIPSQHGVHSYLRAGEPQLGPNAHCVVSEFRTL